MSTGNLVLRTVYVDPDVDDQLRDEALVEGVSKADLFRKYLVTGIKAVNRNRDLFKTVASRGNAPLVLRTVHMDPKLDEKLRVQAFDSRTSKNELMRLYVRVGMSLKDASTTEKTRPPMRSVAKQPRAPVR